MDQKVNKRAVKLALSLYWREMKRFKIQTFLSLFLPGIGTILVFYVPPLIIGKILTHFTTTSALTLGDLLPYVLALALFWTLGEILWRIGLYLSIKTSAENMKYLYIEALDRLAEKDISFFHDNFAGSLTKKALGYAKRFEDFIDSFLFNIVPNILPLPFIGYVLWQFSPWLIVLLLGMLLLAVFVVMPLIKRRQKLVVKREAASNVMAGHLADVIANMDAVKAFAHEDFEKKQHAINVKDFMIKTRRSWDYHNSRVDIATSPLYILTNVFGLILAIGVSQRSSVSVEAVFITFSYFSTVTRVMWEFNRIYRNLEAATSEAAQFTELLLEPPRLNDPAVPSPFTVNEGSVEFSNVLFRYHDSNDDHLFEDFSLKIKGGEKIALVGHSGGGKTTITKLLLRFVDIDDGQVLIDGQDISKTSQKQLRSKIAYVPQEPAMFHRTIADNIRYGKLDANEKAIKEAAKLSHADEFIRKLPEDYGTFIGERGVKLSGGQRQRIAIARAMLKDAPILVLDEATSALDSESEKLIQDALWKLMANRTAIVIAHRLSTIQKMDRIIVLEEGKIVEEGSHKALLAKKGRYAKLWAHQSGGFLED